MTPVGHIHSYFKNSLFSTKRIVSKNNNELSFKEIIDKNLHNFLNQGKISENYIFKELDSDEIKDTIEEFYLRLKKKWVSNKADIELQNRFWSYFPTDIKSEDGSSYHHKIEGKFSSTFLLKNKKWLY